MIPPRMEFKMEKSILRILIIFWGAKQDRTFTATFCSAFEHFARVRYRKSSVAAAVQGKTGMVEVPGDRRRA